MTIRRLARMLFMGESLRLESCYAPASAVRRAALGRWRDGAVAGYARFTLECERPPERRAAAGVLALRIVTRGRLTMASQSLEEKLSRAFGPRAAAALKCAHRLQAAAALCGRPRRLESDLAALRLFSPDESRALGAWALEDFNALRARLEALFPDPEAEAENPLFVSFTGAGRSGFDHVYVGEGWPEGERQECPPPVEAAARPDVREADLPYFLRLFFRLDTFRPGQREAVIELLSGRDAAVLMPTGAGKSLVYQLAALLMPGTALVIEPLVSLIEDQLRHLRALGITRAAAVTGDDPESARRALKDLREGSLALCYAAPERLEIESFRLAARDLAEGPGFSLVAVDEAQCVSAWGHDFRPAYLRAGRSARRWCAAPGRAPPLAALTGTSSRADLERACRELGMEPLACGGASLARPELEFRVVLCRQGRQVAELREILTRRIPEGRFGPGLVFCQRVDGGMGAREVSEELVWSEGVEAGCFTGRPPAGFSTDDWERRKRRASGRFLEGDLPVLCCTRAFGLGVHKPDIRFTAHLGLPQSLEGFYQEAGRAGRDGRKASCWIVVHLPARSRARHWLGAGLSADALVRELSTVKPGRHDDLTRALLLHLSAYPGLAAEREDLRQVLLMLGNLDRPRRACVGIPGQSPQALHRTLSRLAQAGVLEPGGAGPGWTAVDLPGGISGEAALRAAEEELDRVYGEIEPARRSSLGELVELCLDRDPGAALSRRLARF